MCLKYVFPRSDHLSDYSSALSSSISGQTCSSVPVRSSPALRSSVSSTRVLFDILEASLKEKGDAEVVGRSLSFLLSSFLVENGYVSMCC